MADEGEEELKLVADLVKQGVALRTAWLLDTRYSVEAYQFVCQAVEYTCGKLGGRRDVSGRQLLDGICELALDQFGLLARQVLEHWGITATDAFGDIVFNLVEVGLLGKSSRDRKSDFHNVFDLREALDERYQIDLGDGLAPASGHSLSLDQETTE